MKERVELTEMPDKETLEQYLGQMHGKQVKVMLNLETGKFEWLTPREIPGYIRKENGTLERTDEDRLRDG